MLVRPGHIWSREEVLDWVVKDTPPDTLIGFDLGQSLPFADCGAFFPGWSQSPATARDLWALVDAICAHDPHLGVTSFVDHPDASRHFRRHGGRAGDLFPKGRGRMRVTEQAQAAAGCQPTSNFNLVGASQVGKGRCRECGCFTVCRVTSPYGRWTRCQSPGGSWSKSTPPSRPWRRAACGALQDPHARRSHAGFGKLGCGEADVPDPVSDHAADALITAAWMRAHGGDEALWHPAALTPILAQTEGWTFGVA
jgi:hypothetical protein